MSSRILNDPFSAVDHMMLGVRAVHGDAILTSANGRSVVSRPAASENRVKVVSGGGSGHEPSFWGLVGPRSLDGVAVGNVFAAPASSDVLATVDMLGESTGVLFLYGNYQGDRFNFGMAAKRLSAGGVPVAEVLVTDDVASAPAGEANRRRGVAGSLWAFRVASAAASAGYDLADVRRVASEAVTRSRSIGIALRAARLPTADEPSFDIPDNSMELGMGVHGEPGLARIDAEQAGSLAAKLVALLLSDGAESDLELARTEAVALDPFEAPLLLVNLAGATPLMEGYILANELRAHLNDRGVNPSQFLVGNYLTTLDMVGASVSLFWPTTEMRGLLREPAHCVVGLRLPGGTDG